MRRPLLPALLAALALAAPATAQEAAPAQGTEPAGGRLTLEPRSGLADGGHVYVARGQRVEVEGVVSEFVPLQYADVEISSAGRTIARERVLIRQADRGGRFVVAFTAERPGRYVVRAEHQATAEQRGFADAVAVRAVALRRVRAGEQSPTVRLLQRGLARLGYRTSSSGRFDPATARSVLAFRKVNRMARTSVAGPKVLGMLLRGQGGYRLRYPRHGKHVEADLSRQVLVLARGGRVERIYHTSTGAPATPTIRGSFRFYRKDLGTNALGMVHSAYFIRGYAIHGYRSVPTHPASHGCLRVPIPNALEIFRWISIGDRIDVYA
jgi:hypothetical protein